MHIIQNITGLFYRKTQILYISCNMKGLGHREQKA